MSEERHNVTNERDDNADPKTIFILSSELENDIILKNFMIQLCNI